MSNNGQQDQKHTDQPGAAAPMESRSGQGETTPSSPMEGGPKNPLGSGDPMLPRETGLPTIPQPPLSQPGGPSRNHESRPIERSKAPGRTGARGTAAMDPQTRKEVARKGGQAVSRNRQHMAEIGRKGGQSVSKNREHMAKIGRKGGAASRGQG